MMSFDQQLVGKKAEEFVNEGGGFDPIPAGKYPCRVVAVEDKENAAGTGRYVKVQLKVEGQKYAGRQLFDNITYEHKTSSAAQEIGLAKIADLTLACGFADIQKLNAYLGKVVTALIGIQGARTVNGTTYEASNTVRSYSKFDGEVPDVPTFDDNDIPF